MLARGNTEAAALNSAGASKTVPSPPPARAYRHVEGVHYQFSQESTT